ncbi:MAG: ribbon-helix-helix domain-containing protein [Alphaproteobacteria bacterium]|nr:ribbon-helix-helix domain-containing protein [Alphaproteobacteria bacterium]
MTRLTNRVISIYDRKTSMRLALEEWMAFDDICKRERLKRKKLLELIEDHKAPNLGLTCFVRLFTVAYMHKLAKMAGLSRCANNDNKDVYQTFHEIS